MCRCLEKQQRWWGKFRENTSDLLVYLHFFAFCYVTWGVILSAASVTQHCSPCTQHCSWSTLSSSSNSLNSTAMHFFWVEVLRKPEHKLGHILRMWATPSLSWQKTFLNTIVGVAQDAWQFPILRVRNKFKILTVAVVDLWRGKGNSLGSKKIDLNYLMSLLLLPIWNCKFR